jgi:outer membrane protein assembly factor BamA
VNIENPKRALRLACTLACIGTLFSLAGAGQNASGTGPAQQTASPASSQLLSSYEGQNVSSVEIGGRPGISVSEFSSLLAQQSGRPFSQADVDRSAAALKSSGKCTDVSVQVAPDANGLRVLFILEPAIYIGIFQFPGAERFTYSRLVQIANYPPDTPFDPSDEEQSRRNLLEFFQQQGYFQAGVGMEVTADNGHGIVNVLFRATLGRKARFGEVAMAGAPPEENDRLLHGLWSPLARARGAAIRAGKTYNRATLTKATQYLQGRLQKDGYLGADVVLEGAEYHADTNRAGIHFTIKPGVPTHVQIEGAHLWSWTRKSLLPVYQGAGVDDEAVQEGKQAITSYFQAKGYFDVKVDSQLTADKKGDAIVYRITKEKKHKVADISLKGGEALPQSEVKPHIAVEQKHLFSRGKFSQQLLRSSVNNIKAVYQSEGFSSVEVVPSVEDLGTEIRVRFQVTAGPRDMVHSLTVQGADTFPQSQFAPNGLKLAAGQPYSQSRADDDRASIVAHYLQAGYLISSFRETAAQASKTDKHEIDVIYHIFEGPKVYAGDMLTLGRMHTQQRLIDHDVSSIHPGQPLTETQLLTASSRLYDHTGVLDWAEVSTKRPITTQTREDVLVKVHEAKRNDFTYGFGFEVINRGGSIPSGTVALPNLPPVGLPSNFTTSQTTYYGPRGTALYTLNTVRGKGESLSLTAFAGRLHQRIAAYYIDPDFRWSPWKASTSISAERNEENPIFSSQQALGGLQVQRSLDKEKKLSLFLRYNFSQTNLTRVEIPALVPTADRNVRLSTLAANLTHDTRDNALDEHKGVLQTLEMDFNTSKLGSSVDFAKLTGQAAYYKQIAHNIVLANSIRIGLAQPFAGSRVPLSEEFFSGGGDSLRGFPLDGAGPQRQVQVCSSGSSTDCTFIQVPSGGSELLLINSEARFPLPLKKGLGIVAFYDGGNVFPRVGFHDFTSLYSNNAGVGLRYSTPVGPVRVDLGRNLNPIQGVQATQYFISIGQAF